MSGSLNASALSRLLGPWKTGTSPAYRELSDVVRLLILDGRIPLDVALPSERALAETLGLSRTTVTAAYSLLREQGYLGGGQGSRGRTGIPHRPGQSRANPGAPGLAAPEGVLDLAYASLPATGEAVHRAFAEALTEVPALLPGFGYDAVGVPALREAIADRYTAAGAPTTPEQILVTSGAQHALNIVLRTLAGGQKSVLVEHPSYPNALDAIRASGSRIVPVPLPPAGSPLPWDMDALAAVLRQQRPAVAYLVPDFHNPTGRNMPVLQRRRLVREAAHWGTVLVIDETLRALDLDDGKQPPFAALTPDAVSIGSLSKSHWAGLRTGWIRATESLIARFTATRTTMDLGGPVVEQLAAARLVRSFEEPLAARLEGLRQHRRALMELLDGYLPSWEYERPDGGLTVWCRLPAPSSTALTVIAPDFGIRLAAGPRFGAGPAFERYLRVPFTLPPDQLESAVKALRAAQDRLDASPQLQASLRREARKRREAPAAVA